MPEIEFSELPDDLRVKLSEEGQKEVWNRVDEFGGAKAVSEAFNFSQSSMYNWKSKNLALPLVFVRRLLGQNSTDHIQVLKGSGSSGKVENPNFPLSLSDELLTRVQASVVVNSDGVPVYIAGERSLVDRFAELLEGLGRVDYSVYSRDSRFELRFPKFLYDIFEGVKFERGFAALVDEKGEFRDGKVIAGEEAVSVESFEGDLFSREKSFELALGRGDSGRIAELMAEESGKVRSLIQD